MWFKEIGYSVFGEADKEPGQFSLRETHKDVIYRDPLSIALEHLNPTLPRDAIKDAILKLMNPSGHTLVTQNRDFHKMAVEGVPIDYRDHEGTLRYDRVKVFDFEDPHSNDWIAVSQFSVKEGNHTRRPDVVVFVNGLPLVVIELKSPSDENVTILSAWNQLQTYKKEIPSLFVYNLALVISDGLDALIGSLTSDFEWFKCWKTVNGKSLAPPTRNQLQVLIEGVFEKNRFMELMRDYTVFEDDGGKISKKLAGYHQFHAVKVAVLETLRATKMQIDSTESIGDLHPQHGGDFGDKRVGVVWHTQGSGKSLTMVFFVARILRHEQMKNPTVVVLTDRNDLDSQLFATFSKCSGLLGLPPVQAENRADLRKKLSVESGGIIFTTIQKFFPDEKGEDHSLLSQRRNIVVIADEAHRSQYDFIDGYARHMRDALPNASFIGFTGTPIERSDANTRSVFGDHISIYDIRQSVDDGATVPIYYENRLAMLRLDESEKPKLDSDFEEITESQEASHREKVKTKWAKLEAVAGSQKRIQIIAEDIITHFTNRLQVMDGKAMVVCMSRRICVDLYQKLVRLKPEWHSEDDGKGAIKVVMTGSASDPIEWQPHVRSKSNRELLAKRFRDPNDPFMIVLVRDMWLTGFDAPSLHTMYVDKPMRGHGLMQAIARVNRVYKDKPGGLVVDYLGLAHDLKQAINTYTDSGGSGDATVNKEDAVRAMREKYEICCGLFHGFDYSVHSQSEQFALLPHAMEHILKQENGKHRCVKAVRDLRKAFSLSVPHEEADQIRNDVRFFQMVQVALSKRAPSEIQTDEELNHAMRQIVSKAVIPDGIVDIFAAAGLKKPEVSILSEDFLSEIRDLNKPNLAVELLKKLLKGEISKRRKKNLIQARSFSEMLEQTVLRYQNRALEAPLIIEQLIEIANQMREANARGEQLNLTEDELAFYNALESNDSAVQVLGDEKLCLIARKLTKTVQENVKIDWKFREDVRANLRSLIRRNLHKYGYPPDQQEKATKTVIEQAELCSDDWASMQGS